MHHHEMALVAAFIKRSKRDRYREFLSVPRLRHKFICELGHFKDFDSKYRIAIPSNRQSAANVAIELKKRRSPDIVHAISEFGALDQKEMLLTEALKEVLGRGMGTILCCIPGILAFVETEDDRFILERPDLLKKNEYVRFAVGTKDETSYVGRGIFQAAAVALERGEVTGADAEELNDLRHWFGKNLEAPTTFGRARLRLGICWFKSDSVEHISRIWEMVRILERNGIYVKKITTDRPGYVVYEDELQLVAEPFRKGTMPRD
jgi:hypothetical protein